MENLGEFLRQQRENKGVSIEELATRTRIAVRFIKLIEENQFDQLPNVVSAKGFLRSYARCLGLEETPILNRFSEAIEPSGASPNGGKEEGVPSYIQRKQPDRLPFPLWAALSVLVVIFLFLALAFLIPKQKAAPPPVPEEAPLPDPMPPEPSPIPPPPEGSDGPSELPPPAPTPSSAPGPAPSEQRVAAVPLVLLIEAIQPSWIHATIDGTEIKEALLQPSESVRWEAKEKFSLTVGNAGGVRLFLDGKDLGPLGPSGRVVKKEIVVKR